MKKSEGIGESEAIKRVLADVALELVRAIKKFPPMRSSHEGYAIILEEVEELWAEVRDNKRDGSADRIRKEAIQVAAMALRFVIDGGAGWPTNDRAGEA